MTVSGLPCKQVVEDHHDHCEAGHYSAPARLAPGSRNEGLQAASSSMDVDELAAGYAVVEMSGGLMRDVTADRAIRVITVDFDEIEESKFEGDEHSVKLIEGWFTELLAVPSSSVAHRHARVLAEEMIKELRKRDDSQLALCLADEFASRLAQAEEAGAQAKH